MHGTSDLAGRNRIKEIRLERGLTHEELAERAGTSRNTIGMVERGQQAPSVELARRIAQALETDLNTLFMPEALAS